MNRLKPIRTAITAEPATEPVSLDDAKDHLGIYGTDDDTKITAYITAARTAIERLLGMQLITCTYQMGFTGFPDKYDGELHIPIRPATAVTAVSYKDTNNATQTLSTSLYDFVSATPYSYLVPAWNQLWPETRDQPGAENVTLTITAGYADADSVPTPIVNAIKMLIRDLFDYRSAQAPSSEALAANPNYKMLLGLYMAPRL